MERHATEVVWQRPDNRRASSTVLAISSMRLPYYSRAHIPLPLPPPIHNTHLSSRSQNIDFNSRGIERVTEGKDRLGKEGDASREVEASKCSSRLHTSPKHLLSSFRSSFSLCLLGLARALCISKQKHLKCD
jgi:hypothetical protein